MAAEGAVVHAAGKKAGGFLAKMVGKLIRPARKLTMNATSRKALKDAAERAAKKGKDIPTKRFAGRTLEDTTKAAKRVDKDADRLAERLGGKARRYFSKDKDKQEFDTISDKYVAQAKPADFKLNQKFRSQARNTFEAALATGRKPYFHFEGPPDRDVIRMLDRYAKEYGIDVVVDTKPL